MLVEINEDELINPDHIIFCSIKSTKKDFNLYFTMSDGAEFKIGGFESRKHINMWLNKKNLRKGN